MRYFTKDQAVRALRINPRTLDKWIVDAGLNWEGDPADRRKRRMREEQLEALARTHETLLHPLLSEVELRKQLTEAQAEIVQLKIQLGDAYQRINELEHQLVTRQVITRAPVPNFQNKEHSTPAPIGVLIKAQFADLARQHGVNYSTAKGWQVPSEALANVGSAVRWIIEYVNGDPVRRKADHLHRCVSKCGYCGDLVEIRIGE